MRTSCVQAAPISLAGIQESNINMLQVGRPGRPGVCVIRVDVRPCTVGMLLQVSLSGVCCAACLCAGQPAMPARLPMSQSAFSASIMQHVRSQLF